MATKRLFVWFSAAVLILASIGYSAAMRAQIKVLPASASRGEQLLFDKGCVNCHRFADRGGDLAPDLAKRPPHAGTPGLLASAMWNHAPSMWAQTTKLTSADAADMFAYMYSALYFDPPSDVSRGRAVFESKTCANCHREVGGGPGPALSAWPGVRDPIAWAGGMWNHARNMSASMVKEGISWPRLSNQDVSDLMIYLRSLPTLQSRSNDFGLGEPERGRLVFEDSCESCHSFGPNIGKKIDLLQRQPQPTVTGYIASMWNHAELMRAKSSLQIQKIDPEDMPHLIAFLFSEFYFFERGDAARGRRVFEVKNCARCHEQRGTQTGAPNLAHSAELYSPITLTSAVWDHAPAMFEKIKHNGMAWPRFKSSEMADLVAYLNTKVIVRTATR